MKTILPFLIVTILMATTAYCQGQPIELILKTDKKFYMVYEEIIITAEIRNVSSKEIAVIDPDYGAFVWCRLQVKDPSGIKFVYDQQPVDTPVPNPPYIKIAPGQSIEYFTFKATAGRKYGEKFNWIQDSGLNLYSIPFYGDGEYHITASYEDLQPNEEKRALGKFLSNNLDIRIIPLPHVYKIVVEGNSCMSTEECLSLDCSKYDRPEKQGWKPSCENNKCKCMCYGCE